MNAAVDSYPTRSATTEVCRICGNDEGNRRHSVREMMIGLRTQFEYVECAACGCLQLADPPTDLAPYYAADYYSFQRSQPGEILQKGRHLVRRLRNRALLRGGSVVSRMVETWLPDPPLAAIGFAHPRPDQRVLDVGSGAGRIPVDLRDAGFTHVLGIDPFIERDIQHANGVRVQKGRLPDLAGSLWDLIIFHHSFEHIWEQQSTLACARKLLADGGQCMISLPVLAWPWKKYGVHWAELDAPRHFYLHTEKSMRLLASQAGFRVSDVNYDSCDFQFWGSELYFRDIPLSAIDQDGPIRYFTRKQLRTFRRESGRLNREHQGGRASFYLVKHGSSEPAGSILLDDHRSEPTISAEV
jgi:SAM-dependent methyltransferase